MLIPNTISVTDLRRKVAEVLEGLEKDKLYLILQNYKPKGVLADLEYIKTLQEAYEDYLDIINFDDRKEESEISWDEYKKKSLKTK